MKQDDWEQNLDEYIASKEKEAFEWGENDCLMFVAGAIKAMTKFDAVKHIKRQYKSRREAYIVAKNLGCRTLPGVTLKVFDSILEPKDKDDDIHFGDVITAKIVNIDPTWTGGTAGVISREGMMMVPGKDGIVRINDFKVQFSWNV